MENEGLIKHWQQVSQGQAHTALQRLEEHLTLLQRLEDNLTDRQVLGLVRRARMMTDRCEDHTKAVQALEFHARAMMNCRKEAGYHKDLREAGNLIRDHLVWRLQEMSQQRESLQAQRKSFQEILNACLEDWPDKQKTDTIALCLMAHSKVVCRVLPHTFHSRASRRPYRQPREGRRDPQTDGNPQAPTPIGPPPAVHEESCGWHPWQESSGWGPSEVCRQLGGATGMGFHSPCD